MAGNNLSPRQKMINMMYLVLTSLLALQVSSSVLDKFDVINVSLNDASKASVEYNKKTLASIIKSVEEAGDNPEKKAALKRAREIRKATSSILTKIDKYKETLIEKSGGVDEDGMYKGAKDEEKLATWLIGPDNKGYGDVIQKELNTYVAEMNKIANLTGKNKLQKLAMDGDEDPRYKDDKDKVNADWKTISFAQTPMVAALAQFSNFKTKITNIENTALAKIQADMGAQDLKFDTAIPVVTPESRTVAAGGTYRADLFLAASASGVTPVMSVNGNPIPVEAGKGKVEFKVSPAKEYDEFGLAEASYKAKIELNQGGEAKPFVEEIKYFVAKPVIQVQSAAVSALYLGCGNELNVNVPALGSNYKPTFKVSGGNHRTGKKPGNITIIPNGKKVSMTVINDGNTLGTETFKVRPVPPAEIQLYNKNKPINQKTGESISSLRSLKVRAIAEDGFKTLLPKDSRYKISKWTIRLARGSRAVQSMDSSKETVSLGNLMRQAKPGDRLSIEIKTVVRKNYLGKTLPAKVNTKFINIPLN